MHLLRACRYSKLIQEQVATNDAAGSSVYCAADTWETAEEWKREVQQLQKRMENTSGEVRQMLQKQLHQLLRQKDKP